MAGETGTSVGIISLDLRIVSRLNEQLNAIASAANKSAQQSFERVGKTVQESVSKPMENASKSIEKAITTPVENAQKAVQDTLKKTQDQTDDTISQIDAILARHQEEANARLREKVNLPESVPRFSSASATSIFKKRQPDVEASGHAANAPPNLDAVYKPAADAAELLRRKQQSLQMQFDTERKKLSELNVEFSKAASGSKSWDELSAKITASKQRLISFQESMNTTQARIDEPARKAAAAAEKSAEAQKRAQEKAAAAAERAAQRAAQAQERAAQKAAQASQRAAAQQEAVQARVAAAAKKSSSTSAGTLRTQTNAMLSAVTSTSQGVAKVGVMGRALSGSLMGSFAFAVPLALAAGAFAVLRKSISLATVNSDQFKNSLNQVKANLQVAFTPIYQAILPALNSMMAWLAAATKQVAAFISALFGKTYAQSVAATKKMQANAAAANKAKSGSGSKSQGQLAGFDELTVIGQKGGADGTGINYDALNTKGTEAATGIAAKFKAAWAGIAAGFNNYVTKPIKDNLSKFDAPIAAFKALFADIGAQCVLWMQPLSSWFENDFKNALNIGISNAMTVWAGFAGSVAMVATTIWQAWKPIIDWFVTKGLPMLTDMWVECSNTSVAAFEAVKVVFDTFWHGVMDPFYQFVSKVIVDTLNTFKTLWDQYGATTFENIRTAINSMKDILLAFWESFLKPIFDQLFLTLNQLWTDHLQPLVYQIGVFVMELVNGALEIYNGFIAPMVKWFYQTWGPPIASAINTVIKNVGNAVGAIADAAKDIFKSLGGVIDFLVGVFTGNWSRAWNGVKEIFKGVFNALYDIAKAPLNGIIGLINGVISGINMLITGLNSLHVDIPKNPWTDAMAIGFSIPTINSIPYLANGGILTQPTLAMMGEYPGAKNNPEIAAPQSLMLDTFMESMVPMLNIMEEFKEVVVELLREIIAKNPNIILDGTTLARLLKPYIDEENKRVGGTIF